MPQLVKRILLAKDLPPQPGDDVPVAPTNPSGPSWGELFGRKRGNVRTERLALNVKDLSREPPEVVGPLVKGRLAPAPVRTDPRDVEESAAVLTCDLLTAATVVDAVRLFDRQAGDPPCRAYLSRDGGAWQRLSPSVVLTRLVGGNVELHPETFPPRVRTGDVAGRAAERVDL